MIDLADIDIPWVVTLRKLRGDRFQPARRPMFRRGKRDGAKGLNAKGLTLLGWRFHGDEWAIG